MHAILILFHHDDARAQFQSRFAHASNSTNSHGMTATLFGDRVVNQGIVRVKGYCHGNIILDEAGKEFVRDVRAVRV